MSCDWVPFTESRIVQCIISMEVYITVRMSLPSTTAKPSLLVSKGARKVAFKSHPYLRTSIVRSFQGHASAFRRLMNFSELPHNHIIHSVQDHVCTRRYGLVHYIGMGGYGALPYLQFQAMEGTGQHTSINNTNLDFILSIAARHDSPQYNVTTSYFN